MGCEPPAPVVKSSPSHSRSLEFGENQVSFCCSLHPWFIPDSLAPLICV